VYFPFDLHTAAVSDSHLPCHAHAVPLPCSDHAVLVKAMALRPSRDGLWATSLRSPSSGCHTEFHEDCYQKHTNPHNDPYL
jgi:hypothetical protein